MLANRYEILEEIGAGGMGTVFKAYDTQTDEFVAVKQLQSDISTLQPEILERFKREGEILRQLNHPNIVKWLDAVTVGSQHYLIMEYIHGGDLHDLLSESVPPIERTLDIALDIADALTRTHRLNVVHRDLKPANVLIAEDGTPRVTDFGLAHEINTSKLTQQGAVMGTLYYLPPEILRGESVSALADIWSFGVMLFQMVTGNLPFYNSAQSIVLQMILADPIPDIETLRPDVPVALADLIYRMLDKNKEARIPSVRLVGAEIEALLNNAQFPVNSSFIAKTSYEGATQIIQAESRFAEPSMSTLAQVIPHNLPANLMPFVGREVEISAIEALLKSPDKRLISVVGAGGMGKTRLALEIAQRQLSAWVKGVFFVDLAPFEDPAEMVNAIASAVGFKFYDGASPQQQLIDFLRDKPMLLILDNFEHLLAGVPLLNDILRDVADLNVLATSREKLNLHYETVFTIGGLNFLDWVTVDDALEYSIVQLFMQSAKRADPSFELRAEALPAIAQICRSVEGMPLGVLLAAGWVNMLSLPEIAQEIAESVDFLETEIQNIPERHRSMRAVFTYSWQLLNDDERTIFSKLAVFNGGFTRQAAQKITGAGLRTLLSLVNKSLIHRSAEGRFSIHALLRQYANEKLTEVTEVEALHDAHSGYFLSRLKAREADSRGGQQLEFSQDVTTEWANIVAAWHWAIDHQKTQRLIDCAFVMLQYLRIRNAWWVAQPLYDYSLTGLDGNLQTDAEYSLWIILKHDAATFSQDRRVSKALIDELYPLAQRYPLPTEYKIYIELERGMADNDVAQLKRIHQEAVATQDELLIAETLLDLGQYSIDTERNLAQSKTYYQDALNHALKLNNMTFITGCYMSLGRIASIEEAYYEAKDYYERAIVLNEQLGDQTSIANCYNNIALELMILKEFDESIMYSRKSLRIHQELGNHYDYSICLDTLANVYYSMGNYVEAEQLGHECITACTKGGWDIDLAFALKQMGFVQLALGNHEQAQSYWGRSLMTAQANLSPSDMIYVDACGGLAHLIAREGNPEHAYSIVYLVSLQDGIDRHFDDEAFLMEQLENQLTADVVTRKQAEVATLDMDEIVAQLRTEFGVKE